MASRDSSSPSRHSSKSTLSPEEPKRLSRKHSPESLLRLLQCLGHGDTLPGCQTIRLDHYRSPSLPRSFQRRLIPVVILSVTCGYTGRPHHILGEGFGSLHEGSFSLRPEYGQATGEKDIHYSCNQRRFRPDNREIYTFSLRQICQRFRILYINAKELSIPRHPCIAWSHQQTSKSGASLQTPHQRMLAASAADNQNVQRHGLPPSDYQRWLNPQVYCLVPTGAH